MITLFPCARTTFLKCLLHQLSPRSDLSYSDLAGIEPCLTGKAPTDITGDLHGTDTVAAFRPYRPSFSEADDTGGPSHPVTLFPAHIPSGSAACVFPGAQFPFPFFLRALQPTFSALPAAWASPLVPEPQTKASISTKIALPEAPNSRRRCYFTICCLQPNLSQHLLLICHCLTSPVTLSPAPWPK